MRRFIRNGAVLTLILVGGFFLAATYAGNHPDSLVARCVNLVYQVQPGVEDDSELCVPEEPQPVEESLPEQPEPVSCLKSLEPLDAGGPSQTRVEPAQSQRE